MLSRLLKGFNLKKILLLLALLSSFAIGYELHYGNVKINTTTDSLGGHALNTGSPFYMEVAKGNIAGHSIVHKFGKNPAVGTTGFDTIWNGGGEYTGFNATAAETVTVVSSDGNDTLLGDGLQTLVLHGLDADWIEQSEVIELNGTTAVTSQLSYIRCYRAKGLTSGGGTFSTNLGVITIAQSITTANVFAQIPIGYGTTMIAAYTIPAGKKGYIITQSAAIANKQSAAVAIRIKVKQPGSVFTVGGEAALNSQGAGFIERKFTVPAQLPAKTDFFIEAEASSTVAVSAFLDILLIDE